MIRPNPPESQGSPASHVAVTSALALALLVLAVPDVAMAQDTPLLGGGSLKKPIPSVLRPEVKRALSGRTLGKAPLPPPPSTTGGGPVGPAAGGGGGGDGGPAIVDPGDRNKKSPAFGVAPGAKMPVDKAKKTLVGEEDKTDPDKDVWDNPSFEPACGHDKNKKINFNLKDVELYDVVRLMAALTCRKFIIPQNFKRGKKITIIAHDRVTVDEAWRAFLASLEVNGMTIVPSGRFLKLAQSTDAKSAPVPLYRNGARAPADERMVTRLVPLKNVDTQEITNVLLKLKSKAGEIIPYPRTNTLIITDYGHVQRRFEELLKSLDVPGGEDRVWVYQVQYATASELSGTLLQVFEQQAKGAAKGGSKIKSVKKRKGKASATTGGGGEDSLDLAVTKIIPDERTNQLVIIADERAFARLVVLIKKLDVSIPGEGQVHVYYLKNADAEEIAGVLGGLQGNQQGKRRTSTASKAKANKSGGGSAAELFQGEVQINADKATNSLIVVASLKDYLSLVHVVKQLDIRRPQVFVEAIVMEVNLSKSREVGVAVHGGVPELTSVDGESVPLLLGTNLKGGGLNSLLLNPTGLMGFSAMVAGPNKEIAGLIPGVDQIPSFGAVLNALQTNDDVNILSTPHILTTDNEEAEIKVGQNVPFIAGGGGGGGLGNLGALAGLAGGSQASSALAGLGGLGGGLGGSPFFNVQRQDVALTLKLTPQINESDFVRLQIEQTIEELGADNPGLGPTTTKRSARTVIVAKDQQTVVIGGLMRDNVIEGVEKVPFLGDIPVIGYLFRATKKTVQKQNLLLLLTPYIIRDPADFREIFARKMREYREFMEIYGKRAVEPNIPIDYRKKHGLLQEANKLLKEAMAEKEAIDRMNASQDDGGLLFEEIELRDIEELEPAEAGFEVIEPGVPPGADEDDPAPAAPAPDGEEGDAPADDDDGEDGDDG